MVIVTENTRHSFYAKYRYSLIFTSIAVYGYLVQFQNVPYDVGSWVLFFVLFNLLLSESNNNFKKFELAEDKIFFDMTEFSFQDLLHFDVYNEVIRSFETKKICYSFKLKKESKYYHYYGYVSENDKEIRHERLRQIKTFLERKVTENGLILEDINLTKENEPSKRFLILSLLWSGFTLLALVSVCYGISNDDFRYTSDLNIRPFKELFWIPLLVSLTIGWLHFNLLQKIESPFYKLALNARIGKRKFNLAASIVSTVITYASVIQFMHFYNQNFGTREEMVFETEVVNSVEGHGKGGCYRKKDFQSVGIGHRFTFWHPCYRVDNFPVGTKYSLNTIKGSLGAFYFKNKVKW